MGLSHNTTAEQMTQSVLEGVALAFMQDKQCLQNAGLALKNIYLLGGGAQNHYWAAIIASALNHELRVLPQAQTGAACGAAHLAYLADPQHKQTHPFKLGPEMIIAPQPQWTQTYHEKIDLFTDLYRHIKPCFARIHSQKKETA